MIDYISVTLTAIFTGIGVAIGTPVGQWILNKFNEHKHKLNDIKLEHPALGKI